ncbi:MAG: DUF4238 domain-containing protein [Myxococcales bacterium]|nr:DUF4238 domain-containing protein [Myxococcales bacterium]
MSRNNHYVPRFFTRPWEVEERRLVCVTTDPSNVRRAASKTLFSQTGLNSDEVEAWFQRIESRVAEARRRMVAASAGAGLIPARGFPDDDLDTLIALLMLQLHRSGTVLVSDPFVQTLDSLASYDDSWLADLAKGARQAAVYFVARVPSGVSFPEGAFFLVPVAGAPDHIYGFPLSPELVVVAAPRTLSDAQLEALHSHLTNSKMMTALSCGLGRFGRRVVVAPTWVDEFDDTVLCETVRQCQQIAAAQYKVAAST